MPIGEIGEIGKSRFPWEFMGSPQSGLPRGDVQETSRPI
jgi:hypothetical protein